MYVDLHMQTWMCLYLHVCMWRHKHMFACVSLSPHANMLHVFMYTCV